MKIEEDTVGLVINEALHIATQDDNPLQKRMLIRLQAVYYQLLAEGLKPTSPEKIARPLRERLNLNIPSFEKWNEEVKEARLVHKKRLEENRPRLLNSRSGPLPQIEEKDYRELAERANMVGKNLGDEVRLDSLLPTKPRNLPPKIWADYLQFLPSRDRAHISRSISVFERNLVENLGELRTIGPQAMRGLRLATPRTVLLGLTMFEKNPN